MSYSKMVGIQFSDQLNASFFIKFPWQFKYIINNYFLQDIKNLYDLFFCSVTIDVRLLYIVKKQ